MSQKAHLRHVGGGALEQWREGVQMRYFGRFDGDFRDRDALIMAYNEQALAHPGEPSLMTRDEYDRREYDRIMRDFDTGTEAPAQQQGCTMCKVRRESIAAGTWDVGFRSCPHCGEPWARHG